ncbi:hypothetical protein [Streptomyces olindensis]|uniref:hypothetical protein n=1 Tax=Streptomyces olindensis TaxID=358823 RepID=UPI0033E19957
MGRTVDTDRLLRRERESTRRRALRTALRWRGFAPLYDALWVSPHPLTPKGWIEVADLARGAVTVFRARQQDLDTEADRNPLQAWDLPGIAEHYQASVTADDGPPRAGPGGPRRHHTAPAALRSVECASKATELGSDD